MNNKDYFLPAMAAIAIAFLFPIYWGSQLLLTNMSLEEAYTANLLSLDMSDAVVLLTGMLMIYVYYSLKRILVDQHNYQDVNLLLILMIGVCAVFHVGLLGFDLAIFLAGRKIGVINLDLIIKASYAINIGCLILLGLLDILIGIFLLRSSIELPSLVKIFAVIILIQGFFELTVIFSLASIFIYPLSMLVLAAYFLKKPQMIEVV